MTAVFTAPQLLTAHTIIASWNYTTKRSKLQTTTLIVDAFDLSGIPGYQEGFPLGFPRKPHSLLIPHVAGRHPVTDLSLRRFEMKTVTTDGLLSGYVNVGTASVVVISKGRRSCF